jgi:hypothetical protein
MEDTGTYDEDTVLTNLRNTYSRYPVRHGRETSRQVGKQAVWEAT